VDIDDLRTFVEVADTGGITPAARRLGLSKSVVSRRIARIEAELGVQLVLRTTRGASLTEAGGLFRGHAARVVAEIDRAQEAIDPGGSLRGLLRVAVPLTIGPTEFAPILAELAARHPELRVHASYSDRFVDLVAEGFDCAIRVGYLPDSALVARRVGPMTGSVVASPGYIAARGAPARPEEVQEHEALMQGTESWQFTDGGRPVTVQPQGRFKADNGSALVAAALAGLGIAWLPDCLTADHRATGALVRLLPDHPPPAAGVFVLRPPGQFPARKVQALTELLLKHFATAA
jgi:DNA-binding transcriptional LysR family regulator